MTLSLKVALLLSGSCLMALPSVAAPSDATSGASDPVPVVASVALSEVSAREAIRSLARRAGLVVIFDSRKIEQHTRVEIDPNAPPQQALERVLAVLDLRLEPVGGKTYAITDRAPELQPTQVIDVSPSMADLAFADTIIVTGAAVSTVPLGHEPSIVEIDQDTIQLLSEAKVSEAIFELPQALASFSSANTTLYGATAGLNLADLRGLGPERTQVLVNGRRRTPASGGNGTVYAVDLTTLPHSFVKQVEVLDYNQSVAVGPDAVAGSVNLVLDTSTNGFEVGARYGLSELGDAEQIQTYLKWGSDIAGGRGRLFGAVEYSTEDGLIGADRELTAAPFGFALDGRQSSAEEGELTAGFAGSPVTPGGLVSGLIFDDGTRAPAGFFLRNIFLTQDGGLEPYDGREDQLYNWSARQTRILPNERVVGVATAEYQVTDKTDVFAEFHFGVGSTDVAISPLPAFGGGGSDPFSGDGIRIRLDNPIVPEAVRNEVEAITEGTVEEIVVSKRLVALGDRLSDVDRDYVELIIGGEHRLSGSSSITGHYRFGRTSVETTQRGLLSRERLEIALSPDLCDQLAACTLVNPFTLTGFDAGAEFVTAQSNPTQIDVTEHEFYLDGATDLEIPGLEPLSILSGVSWRRGEISTRRPDGREDLIGFANVAGFDGSLETAEIFTRATISLLTEESSLGAVRLGAGGRLVHSSQSGWTQNGEVFVDWTPINGFGLRGVGSYGERSPNLSELYLDGIWRAQYTVDPCSGLAPDAQSVVAENCFSDGPLGVAEGFVGTGALVNRAYYGSADLDPEVVHNWRADIIVEPHELFDIPDGDSLFRVSYTDIRVDHAYDVFGDPLNDCYNSPDLSALSCGTNPFTDAPLIRRDQESGQLLEVGHQLFNLSRMQWRGIDVEARVSQHHSNLGPIDRTWGTVLHTHLLEADTSFFGEVSGSVRFPRDRTLMAVGVDIGAHQFAVQGQRRGQVRTEKVDIDEANIDAITTLDLAWRADLSEKARFTATISNVTDKMPEIVAFSEGLNVFAEHYDIVGRRYSVELDFRF